MADAGFDGRLEDDYQALRLDAGGVWLPRDFVRVAGPDAQSFLQGQLSQDVNLEVGGSAWSFLLQPQGKVVALLRLLRAGDDEYVLDTDAGWGSVVVERLNRFKLRVDADVEPLDWRCLGVRGPHARDVVADGKGSAVVADWPGLPGVDLVGPDPKPPPGLRPCSVDAYEVVRIEAGVPVMGRELDERTIPAEAGVVDRAVSFTKGCYTGQELVARIDARGGHVPRRLRGLVVAGGDHPPASTVLMTGGREVGSVTSLAWSPGRRATVGLAYVRRDVDPPADVDLRWDGGTAVGRVEELPLVP